MQKLTQLAEELGWEEILILIDNKAPINEIKETIKKEVTSDIVANYKIPYKYYDICEEVGIDIELLYSETMADMAYYNRSISDYQHSVFTF